MTIDKTLSESTLSDLFVRMVVAAMQLEDNKKSLIQTSTTFKCVSAIQSVKEAFNEEFGIDVLPVRGLPSDTVL